jgi:hypothetical protein
VRYTRWAIVAVFFLPGCADPPPPIVEARGVVRLDGVPLKKVEVRFIPMIDNGMEFIAKGITDDAGRFTLTCKGQSGACACGNQVVIRESEIPARLRSETKQVELHDYLKSLGGRPLPQKYSSLVDNPLIVNVTAGQKEYLFDLKR